MAYGIRHGTTGEPLGHRWITILIYDSWMDFECNTLCFEDVSSKYESYFVRGLDNEM